MRVSLGALLVLVMLGCAKVANDPALGSGIEGHQRVDGTHTANAAQWLFDHPLKSLESSEHYVIDVLFLGEQASFTLFSHFNSFARRDGVRVIISRDKELLHLEVGAPDVLAQKSELPSTFVSPDGRLQLRIEVQNATASGPRVLVWNAVHSWQGEKFEKRSYIDEGNADVDSRSERWVFPTQGRGVFWGLEYSGLRVRSAHREAPYAQ